MNLSSALLDTTHDKQKLIDISLIQSIYKPREKNQHKGNFGHALIIAGTAGKIGAAILATKACLRSGAGLVTTCVPEIGREIIHETIPEAMVMSSGFHCLNGWEVSLEAYSVGIGPGLGTDDKTVLAFSKIVTLAHKPMVIDADGINILASHPSLWDHIPNHSIVTPHPKEFERLFGKTTTEVERFQLAQKKAIEHQIVVVLKGANTRIFTPDGMEYINTTGNVGMATGGSGDVLTGVITGLLAQHYSPSDAAIFGVFLHGLAGDLALDIQSEESLLAGDIIQHLGAAYKYIVNKKSV